MTLTEKKSLGNGQYDLIVTLEASEFNSMVNKEFSKQVKQVNIPGFRKGKVPRSVFERYIGKEALYQYAVQEKVDDILKFALDETEIDLIERPDWDLKEASIETGATIVYTVQTYPEVTDLNYKGLDAVKHMHPITDDMVMAEIEVMREKVARIQDVDDKAVEVGNIAVIDYKGFVDGVPFDGGFDSEFSLEIGSNTFIPGFEDQIVGHKAGEEFSINVTFPDNYNQELIPIDKYDVDFADDEYSEDINDDYDDDVDIDELIDDYVGSSEENIEEDEVEDEDTTTEEKETLAGKDAVFEIKLHQVQVKELPVLDDDFAMDVSEFDSVDELKESIFDKMTEENNQEADYAVEQQLRSILSDMVDIEIPESLQDIYVRDIANNYFYRVSQMGIDPQQYINMLGGVENLRETFKEDGIRAAKADIALSYVALNEDISIIPEQYEERLVEISKSSNRDLEELRNSVSKAGIIREMKIVEAMKKVQEYANITEDIHDISEHDHEHEHEHDHEHEED